MRILAAGTVAVAFVVAACFSEHESATAPATGRCNLPLTDDVAGSTVVAIRNFAFQPLELRIHAGEKVTWVNCEDTPQSHTSTADAGAWESPVLAQGQAFSRTFDQVGTFPYHCAIHPGMIGTVVVQ